MKLIKSFQIGAFNKEAFTFLFLGLLVTSCGQERKNQTAKDKSVQSANVLMNTVLIPVEGMSCASCVANVKKTVHSLAGVKSVEVSLDRREAKVTYAKSEISAQQLKEIINELGYKAGEPVQEKKQ